MEKQFIYILHKIEGEKDLPKVEGAYFALIKHGKQKLNASIYFKKGNGADMFYWMNSVDFWLEEKEVPTDEEMEKIGNYDYGYRNRTLRAFMNGILNFKSKLKLK